MLHTQLQHLPRDTFKFYLKLRNKFFRDATTQASPSMLKHLSSIILVAESVSEHVVNFALYPGLTQRPSCHQTGVADYPSNIQQQFLAA